MDKYIGKLLDNRYEILEVIGVGGMAMVYKARCHRLNRLVAVKILKDDYASDDDFRRRFHAESQAVAMLSHPNIVAVYDVSRSSELEYIVMELIDGITLKQYIQRTGALSWREALHYVTQIVKALSHAHSRGIIHRDIKPHNIMVLRDGSVKVADFGIARFTTRQSTLTQEALGSVHYVSPEQARGSHIDARSDIYSAGVVLYEMLSNRLPYEGDSPIAVAIQHINSLPLTLRETNPEVPETLEAITLKAMAPDINRRYGSADELLVDLEEFRRNPNIVIRYDPLAAVGADDPGEPTRKIPVAGNGARSGSSARTPKSRETRTSWPGNGESRGISDKNRPRPYGEDRQRRRNPVAPALGAAAALLGLIGLLVWLVVSVVLPILDPSETEMEPVPNVVGLTIDEATAQHGSLFIFSREDDEYSGTVEAGIIIRQKPGVGVSSPKNSVVSCIVSRGPRTVQLPDYANRELRWAQTDLGNIEDIFVRYDPEPVWVSDDTIQEGNVIRTDPPAGSDLTEGVTVRFYVSAGPEKRQFAMPGLLGKSDEEASQILLDHNLTRGEPNWVEHGAEYGTVVVQSVPQGQTVTEKDVITYSLSLGPAVSDSPSPTPDTEVTPSPPPWTATPDPGGTPTDPPTPGPSTAVSGDTERRIIAFKPSAPGQYRVQIIQDGVSRELQYYTFDEYLTPKGFELFKPASSDTSKIEIYFDGVLTYDYTLNFLTGETY